MFFCLLILRVYFHVVTYIIFFLMLRRPPRSTRTDTLFPYPTLFRSVVGLIGYQSMKDGALEQASPVAEKVATDAASRHMENIRQSVEGLQSGDVHQADRKSTRLNSSH